MVPFNSCSLIFGRHTLEKSSSQREIGIRLHYYTILFHEDYLYGCEFPHDAVPPMRSDDNRRAAGAVDSSAFGFHYEQTKSSGDGRPGGEAFVSLCVH